MTSEAFRAFAAAKGWKCVDNNAFGVYRGYPFLAGFQPGRVSVIKVTFHAIKGPSGKDLTMKVLRALRKALPKGCSFTQPVAGQLQLVCGGVDDLLGENVRRSMDLMADTLQEGGLVLPQKCACCGKTDCDSLALWNGVYAPVHRICVEQRAGSTAVAAEMNKANGSYLTGFIGAFLGGLVGILPTVLTVALMDSIYSLLYALIPICAYQGYKLLRGRMTKGAFWITCLVSVFHLFSIEQIYFYIMIVREMGLWPTPMASIQLYWSVATLGDVFTDMASSFLFLGLGIFIAWGHIRSTASDAVQNMAVIRESLTPYAARSMPDL